jgi:hypothetical protein
LQCREVKGKVPVWAAVWEEALAEVVVAALVEAEWEVKCAEDQEVIVSALSVGRKSSISRGFPVTQSTAPNVEQKW